MVVVQGGPPAAIRSAGGGRVVGGRVVGAVPVRWDLAPPCGPRPGTRCRSGRLSRFVRRRCTVAPDTRRRFRSPHASRRWPWPTSAPAGTCGGSPACRRLVRKTRSLPAKRHGAAAPSPSPGRPSAGLVVTKQIRADPAPVSGPCRRRPWDNRIDIGLSTVVPKVSAALAPGGPAGRPPVTPSTVDRSGRGRGGYWACTVGQICSHVSFLPSYRVMAPSTKGLLVAKCGAITSPGASAST